MIKADRRKIERLPRGRDAWEVGVMPLQVRVGGELVNTFAVVEAKSGYARHVATVQGDDDPLAGLADAFLRPHGAGLPARPSQLRCADEALRARLAEELGKLVPVVQAPTPALDEVGRRLRERMAGIEPPGITAAVGLWRMVLDRFVATAPWERIGDDVELEFAGGGLDGGAAVLLGNSGESFGFAWFPGGAEAVHEFRVLAGHDPQRMLDVRAILVNLDLAEALHPDDVAACEKLGLALAGGRYPWVVVTGGGTSRGPTPAEQAVVLRALAATVEARSKDPVDPHDGRRHAVDVRTPDGAAVRVTVTYEPADLFEGVTYEPGDPPSLRGPLAVSDRTADGVDAVLGRVRGEAFDLLALDGGRAVGRILTLEGPMVADVRAALAGGRIRLVLESDTVTQERVVPCTIAVD